MSSDYETKHCKYCGILIFWVLDPQKRTYPNGSPRYVPLEALNQGKKHQCSKYDPPLHSGREYNLHNPLEFQAIMRKLYKRDMVEGKIWCIRCDMAHLSKAPCWWLREIGFVPHTELYSQSEWTQPCTFFKVVHKFLMEQGHASLHPGSRPRDLQRNSQINLQKRKILAAEQSEKIF